MDKATAAPSEDEKVLNTESKPKYDPRYPSGEGFFVPFSDDQKTGWAYADDPTGTPFLPRILP